MNKPLIVWIILFCFNLHSMENTPLLPEQKNHYSKENENKNTFKEGHFTINDNLCEEDLNLLIEKYSKTTCKQDCDYFMVVHLALSGGSDYRKYITNAELRAIKERMIEDGITDLQLQQSVAQEYMKHKNKVARRATYYVCGLAVASGLTIVITTLKPWQYF